MEDGAAVFRRDAPGRSREFDGIQKRIFRKFVDHLRSRLRQPSRVGFAAAGTEECAVRINYLFRCIAGEERSKTHRAFAHFGFRKIEPPEVREQGGDGVSVRRFAAERVAQQMRQGGRGGADRHARKSRRGGKTRSRLGVAGVAECGGEGADDQPDCLRSPRFRFGVRGHRLEVQETFNGVDKCIEARFAREFFRRGQSQLRNDCRCFRNDDRIHQQFLYARPRVDDVGVGGDFRSGSRRRRHRADPLELAFRKTGRGDIHAEQIVDIESGLP